MPIRIAVPNDDVYTPLIENAEKYATELGVQIFKVPEKQCFELLKEQKVDVAFVSPLSYCSGVSIGDFRIIPATMLAIEGYSGAMNLLFKENLVKFKKVCYPNNHDFAILMTQILLEERYGIECDNVVHPENQLPKDCDAIFTYEPVEPEQITLDVTEDWFDTFAIPMPLGLWVCRNEEAPDNIVEILIKLKADDLLPEELISGEGENVYDRHGRVIWRWDDSMREALEQIFELLYMRNLVSEISAVKLFGEEVDLLGIEE